MSRCSMYITHVHYTSSCRMFEFSERPDWRDVVPVEEGEGQRAR